MARCMALAWRDPGRRAGNAGSPGGWRVAQSPRRDPFRRSGRRVEIARALLHRPALLLCDEATVGLDVKARQDIVAYLHDETAAGRLGVLWATHLTRKSPWTIR